jgi:hypothetical protein
MSGSIATEYAAQVIAARRSSRDERDAGEGHGRREPVARVQALEAERLGDERDEDRKRPEHERDGRRGREAHGVDECELVQPDAERGDDDHEAHVPARDPKRVLPPVRERREDDRADGEADGRVGERLPAVCERVLDDREVEAPEEHGREEQDVCGEAVPHGRQG